LTRQCLLLALNGFGLSTETWKCVAVSKC